jgi:sterol desaturase/sphingolipid hydroxylase (fatty acid hydroxylase superfamily)
LQDPAVPNESLIRLSCFAGVLLIMVVWELASPRRPLAFRRAVRWRSNLLLVALDTLAVRMLVPMTAVAAAEWARAEGVGLWNVVDAPLALAAPVSVLVLDLAIYAQHLVFHLVPVLWRLHRVHHADPDFDVTTALRFHPLEILLSMGIKIALVTALGAPAVAVVVFEVLLNGTAMFNHGNVRLPRGIDRWLRLLVVTPEMHRVHHSVLVEETNSNYGFNLPWWDRLFGSYRDQPARGHEQMEIGLSEYPGEGPTHLGWALVNPFTRAAADRPRR